MEKIRFLQEAEIAYNREVRQRRKAMTFEKAASNTTLKTAQAKNC